MKSLDEYSRLTIKVSKLGTANGSNNHSTGHGFLVECDEIPRCRVFGATIADALERFQKLAYLVINLT